MEESEVTAANRIGASASAEGCIVIRTSTREDFGQSYPVTIEVAFQLVEEIMAAIPKAKAAREHHEAALRAVK